MTTLETPPETSPAPGAGTPPGPKKGLTFEAIAIIALGLAAVAMILAVFSMALSARAVDELRATPAESSGGGAEGTTITLDEFTLTPSSATVPAGSTITVVNGGTTVHDLAVEGQASPELNAGEEGELDVSSLAAGTYTMFCQIPGHRDSGMEGELVIE